MANYVVKIYNQTGFDTCNVPDSSRMIANNFTPYKEYTTFELVQGRYLSSLRVQLTAKEANKIDLVVISSDEIYDTTVYTVDGYTMMAPDVCEFRLLLEPYSTLGGFGYDSGNWVLNGSLKRCHVSVEDDNKNFYTLPEPFENREPIEWSVNRLNPASEYITLMETLSIPAILNKDGDSIVRAIKDDKININCYTDTKIGRGGQKVGAMVFFDGTNKDAYTVQYMEGIQPRELISTELHTPHSQHKVLLGSRWWDASKTNYSVQIEVQNDGAGSPTVVETITGSLSTDLVGQGRSGDITAIWEVPKNLVMIESSGIDYDPCELTKYGGCNDVIELEITGNIALTKWSQTTYNNKLNYGQDLMVKVYNPASGSSVEHQVTEIMTPGSAAEWISSVPYSIMGDVRPNGSPIFMFNYLNKADNKTNMIEILNGGSWRQVNLNETDVMDKMAQLQQHNTNVLYGFDQETLRINEWIDGFKGIFDTVGAAAEAKTSLGTIAGIGSGILSSAQTMWNDERTYWRNNTVNAQQNKELATKTAFASVTLNREATNYANDLDKNAFFAIVSHFSNHDLQAFDTFLTRYGYNVGNMPFDGDQTYFYNRPSYNFVQVNDMTVESVTGNVNLVNDCIERLKQGLRIWHVKPNAKDMLAGGNR